MKGLWVKLSVDYLDDPKIAAAGVVGEALFVRGLAWAKKANQSSIPGVMLTRLGTGIDNVDDVARSLVDLDLWRYDEQSDTYSITAWDSWQTIDSGKSDAGSLGNHRRWHGGKIVPGCAHCASETPTKKEPAPAKKEPAPVPDSPLEARELCDLMADLMVNNGCRRPTVTATWLRDMDSINRLDGHDWDTIRRVLRWSQADQFWKSNILSPGKLRKQFERLRIKAADSGLLTVAAHEKKEAWTADPSCVFCRGDGWVSRETETGATEYAPCHCRTVN